jgi:predicted nucleotidyltransferase
MYLQCPSRKQEQFSIGIDRFMSLTHKSKPANAVAMRRLAQVLQTQPQLEFAVLVGSRATGKERADSDWDIALQWSGQLDWLSVLGLTETLRHTLADELRISPNAIDLIELRRANLVMRASVAEEGLTLAGDDTLAWAHFLQRTWRELEDYYWSKHHAA